MISAEDMILFIENPEESAKLSIKTQSLLSEPSWARVGETV